MLSTFFILNKFTAYIYTTIFLKEDNMLEFCLKGHKIKLSFSFFAVLAVLFFIGDNFAVVTALFCCFIHEFGHMIMMCKFSVPINEITLYGGGIKLKSEQDRLYNRKIEIYVLLAGAGINIMCFFIFKGILTQFAYTNLILGLFNLLPYKYFDGGRVLKLIFEDSVSIAMNSAYKVIRSVLVLLTICVIILMLYKGITNFSLIITLIYIVISEVFC